MTRTSMAALSLSLLLILAAPAARSDDAEKADPPKGDLAKIQGKWKGMVGDEKNIPVTAVFKDNTVTVHVTIQERELDLKGEIKLDETKSPKTWDWTKFKGPNGDEPEDNLAIYKFDGEDKIILCSGGPGNERPTKFEAGENGPPNLVEFTRVKEETKKDEKK